MSKRYDDPIEVEVKAESTGEPLAFRWRGRRYGVDRLLKYYREVADGWDAQRMRKLECFCVEAEGGTYELRHEHSPGHKNDNWKLFRVWD